jgi:hypothetical protein
MHSMSQMSVFYWKPVVEEALQWQFVNTVVAVVGDEKGPRFNRWAPERCSTG